MARAKLELPEKFLFYTDIPVRIGDINYGGHLGNDAVLALAHEARVRFLKQHGWSELNIEGKSTIMADAVIVYKSEAFQGDVMVVEVTVADLTTSGCDFLFRLANKASGKEVARVKTGIVFYDYEHHKVVQMPEKFRSTFSR
jgi:acyl-CoA thioester hydrolase